MFGSMFKLTPLLPDLSAPDADTRTRAMLDLVQLVRKSPSTHAVALGLFREAIEKRLDPHSTAAALQGIEHAAGLVEADSHRRDLLQDARPDMVAAVAGGITDALYAPILMDLLHRHADLSLRETLARTLGRMRDPAALPALVACLDTPPLRPHTIEALADLGDSRAIPHIEPFLADTTDAWPIDNHGPMLRVCDLAGAAIRRLRGLPPQSI